MKFSLPILYIPVLIVAAFPNVLYSSTPSIQALPFAPFDDDPALHNDCNYCHAHHNASKGIPALLNEREERYSHYLNSSALSESGEQSAFERESSRKCPRSRAKHNR